MNSDDSNSFQLQLVQLCHEFEATWTPQTRISLKPYLRRVPRQHRAETFKTLLEIDIERRRRARLPVQPEDYSELGAAAVRYASHYLNNHLWQEAPTHTAAPVARETIEVSNYFKSDTIGPYQLIEQIGEGGMGRVWLARQTHPVQRRVALKLIRPGHGSREAIARFEAERQALAMMKHNHIAKMIGAGTAEDGSPYFVMEYVAGDPVTRFADQQQLSITDRLKLFVEICQAIQHAHQMGILHRDLKPSNLLVHLEDGRPLPKVIDFGLAKALHEELRLTEHSELTEIGRVVGTLRYMSPEQASLGDRGLDARSDIYSLGVILYELLVGCPPIESRPDSPQQLFAVLETIRSRPPQKPSQRFEGLPPETARSASINRRLSVARLKSCLAGDLDWITMKALAIEPDRRYQTAHALAEDIEAYLRSEPVKARPPSAPYLISRFAQRNRSFVATALGMTLILLASTIAVLIFAVKYYRVADDYLQVRDAAVEARIEAEEQLAAAVARENLARQSMEVAQAANHEAQTTLARANFLLANSHWSNGQAGQAQRALASIPHKHRQLEWYLAHRQFNGGDVTLFDHQGNVYGAAFAPDGRQLVTVGSDGQLKTWDSTTGKLLRSINAHDRPISSVVFSPSGDQLVTASSDGTARIWTWPELGSSNVLKGHGQEVSAVDFNASGTKVATACHDGSIRIWEAPFQSRPRTLSAGPGRIMALAFHPTRDQLLSSDDRGVVKLWNSETEQPLQTFGPYRSPVTDLAFNHRGDQFAACCGNAILLVETSPDGRFDELTGHRDPTEGVAFSPDGSCLASAGQDGQVILWNTRSRQIQRRLAGHSRQVWDVTFSADASRLATAGAVGQVKLWTRGVEPGEHRWPPLQSKLTALTTGSSGTVLAVGTAAGALQFGTLTEPTDLLTIHVTAKPITALASSPSGNRFACAAEEGPITIWDLTRGHLDSQVPRGNSSTTALAFSPRSPWLFCAGQEREILVWDYQQKTFLEPLQRPTQANSRTPVSQLAVDASGRWLAALGPNSSELSVFDLETRKPLDLDLKQLDLGINLRARSITSMAFHPAAPLLAIGLSPISQNATSQISILNLEETEAVISWRSGSHLPIESMVFSPDGERLVSAVSDSQARIAIWDRHSGQALLSRDFPCSPLSEIQLAFSGDRRWLIALDNQSPELQFWDADPEPAERVLSGEGHRLSSARLAEADSTIVALGDGNKPLRWNLRGDRLDPPLFQLESKKPQSNARYLLVNEIDALRLVDRDRLEASRSPELLALRATLPSNWHREQNRLAIDREDWHAAAFHAVWMLNEDPEDVFAFFRYREAMEKLPPDLHRHPGLQVAAALPPATAASFPVAGGSLTWNEDGTVLVETSHAGFQKVFDSLVALEYSPTSFDVYLDPADQTRRIRADFRSGPRLKWEMRSLLEPAEFEARNDHWSQIGGALIWEDELEENGKTFRGGIWQLRSNPQE